MHWLQSLATAKKGEFTIQTPTDSCLVSFVLDAPGIQGYVPDQADNRLWNALIALACYSNASNHREINH